MCTILTKAEAIINSRPLAYVHSDVDETQLLTPAHFLVGQRLTCLPPKPFPADTNHPTAKKEEMTRRWRYRQRLMTNFWSRWWREYLLDLKSAHLCWRWEMLHSLERITRQGRAGSWEEFKNCFYGVMALWGCVQFTPVQGLFCGGQSSCCILLKFRWDRMEGCWEFICWEDIIWWE